MAEFTQLIQKTRLSVNINGAILATLAALSFSVSMSLIKYLNADISTLFIVFIRSCCGFLFFILFFIKNKTLNIKTKKFSLHALRVILTVAGMISTYYAYRSLPIAFATSIGMTGPLFTTVLSVLVLKDSIGFWKWILVVFGYLGILIVIRPTDVSVNIGILSALIANVLAACSTIIVKILSKSDSTTTIMLYSNTGITIILFLLNIQEIQQIMVISMLDITILCFMGLLSIFTQFCLFTALKYSNPSFLAPFEYIRIFFVYYQYLMCIIPKVIVYKKLNI